SRFFLLEALAGRRFFGAFPLAGRGRVRGVRGAVGADVRAAATGGAERFVRAARAAVAALVRGLRGFLGFGCCDLFAAQPGLGDRQRFALALFGGLLGGFGLFGARRRGGGFATARFGGRATSRPAAAGERRCRENDQAGRERRRPAGP